MSTIKVYFISGLAADSRIFKNIRLPEGWEIEHLDWIPPLAGEPLDSYALRLAERIDRSRPFALLGMSMGGMIAAILARHFTPLVTVIISSVPAPRFLPPYFKWGQKLGLHKIVPMRLLKSLSLIKRLFSAETNEDKMILRQVIRDSDPRFIRWAMDAILTWEGDELPPSYIQLHGSRDEVLPARYVRPHYLIKGAGHIMILNRAAEINAILERIFSGLNPGTAKE
jgi:pimeloyl-ACP methyl ester carboxylesterase